MPKDDQGVDVCFVDSLRPSEYNNLQADCPVRFVITKLRTGAKYWFFLDKPYDLSVTTGDNTPIVFQGEGLAEFTLEGKSVGSCFQLWGGPNYWRIIPHFLPEVQFSSTPFNKGF